MLKPDSFAGPRAFARWALEGDRLRIAPQLDRIHSDRGLAIECILFRESCWQIELVTLMPNAVGVMHRHNRCSSADLALGGTGIANIGGRDVLQRQRGSILAQLFRIDRSVWHGGSAGPQGSILVSFQQWHDGDPDFISTDWETFNGHP
jgi:hypothetical protein